MRRVHFVVAGIPVTQGSKRALVNRHTGRAVLVDDNPHLMTWRESIGNAARGAQAQLHGPLPRDVPVALRLHFALPKPASAPKTRRTWPLVKDVDKLTRAVFDALTGVLYTTDAQVVSVYADKDFPLNADHGWTGVLVHLETLGDD